MTGIRVLVCGGSTYPDWERVFAELDRLHAERGVDLVIHGAHTVKGLLAGADRWAERWARVRDVPYLGWPNWGRHMLEKAKPELSIGFPGGRSTKGMLNLAREAGVEVIEVAA